MCYSFVVMKKLSIPLFAMALGVCWASASLAAQASPATVTKNESLAAAYLESIRDYPAALTAFFQAMPKGGDLHHHFSGSIYTESLVDEAFRQNLYINPQTLVLRTQRPDGPDAGWLTLHEWSRQIGRYEVERRLLRHWSALDFDDSQGASYDDFFDTFGRFDLAADELFRSGLLEIKARAIADNISYIETMLQRSSFRYLPAQQAESWTLDLLRIQERQDTSRLFALLREIQAAIGDQSAQQALGYQQDLENMHRSLALDEPAFTIRYQDYVLRILPPAKVFADMLTAFQVSQRSPLVAGVNIVAPEHDPVALRDYWLHMHFYQFLSFGKCVYYMSFPISGPIPNQSNGFGAVWFPVPDLPSTVGAIALYNRVSQKVVQFFGYRSTMVAQDGVAMGMSSTQGIDQYGGNPIEFEAYPPGTSMQAVTPAGGQQGNCPSDFLWVNQAPQSRGQVNTSQSPLPIELLDFTATLIGERVLLKWRTATELNNDYMTIERSTSPQSGRFVEIGRVAGAGTSYDVRTYSLWDEHPEPGLNYYRLRQVDYDDQETYSELVVIRTGKADTGKLEAAPNPATSELFVQWPAAGSDVAVLQLIDANGRLLQSTQIPAGATGTTLGISDLAPGAYLLRQQDGREVRYRRFVKQ